MYRGMGCRGGVWEDRLLLSVLLKVWSPEQRHSLTWSFLIPQPPMLNPRPRLPI